MFEYVIKRDGRRVKHDPQKITDAIYKAAKAIGGSDYSIAENLSKKVQEAAAKKFSDNDCPTIEQIQDVVEKVLIENGHAATAKEYILYRDKRTKARNVKTKLFETIRELTYADSADSDIKRENANINTDTAMGTMLKYGSSTAKEFYEAYVLEPDEAKAHMEGDIHIHDLDFYTLTTTCCQIDLQKLFKNGFCTGHGFIREPKSIATYASLTCIAIQSNQNDQHGGQSIPNFDYDLAPGVKKTYIHNYIDNLHKGLEMVDSDIKEDWGAIVKNMIHFIEDTHGVYPSLDESVNANYTEYEKEYMLKTYPQAGLNDKIRGFARINAIKDTDRATYQAMEALVHNLNTMHSRAGAQTPFSSINYGTDTSAEGRMVIRNILLAEEAGLGNGETPIFPIHIFKVKEGVNYNEGDPNYDMLKLACRVSAKRLFPNFSFIDAPFNLKYYDPTNPKTEIAYMGCVRGDEVVTYRVNNKVSVSSIKELWKLATTETDELNSDDYGYVNTRNIEIFDSSCGEFVNCLRVIKNENKNNWVKITFDDGKNLICTEDHPLPVKRNNGKYVRTHVKSMAVGDMVPSVNAQWHSYKDTIPDSLAWSIGMTASGVDMYEYNHSKVKTVHTKEQDIPDCIYNYTTESKLWFFGGLIDGFGRFVKTQDNCLRVEFIVSSKTFALQLRAFLLITRAHNIKFEQISNGDYCVSFSFFKELLPYTKNTSITSFGEWNEERNCGYSDCSKVVSIEPFNINEPSYDVETESDRFDVSGINSHNCRTRVMANEYDHSKEIVSGRGNLSFTSINLPRLAIKANGNIEKFYKFLDDEMSLVVNQLLNRLQIQSQKKALNYPFLMQQGVWIDSENLKPDDTVGEVLKHGTLSIGFIGLAETLVSLIGKHHGESDEAQQLGLEIISYMRNRMDAESRCRHLNFSLLATPAENLCGRFVKMDADRYGKIPGVTDREYYTNSFHVPVYYKITAAEKIRREAPYHELTNAGHISYIELDGDPSNNVEAFMSIVRFMKEQGIGYGSINHPVDRDPECGYTGIINDVCPKCGRREEDGGLHFDRIRRITGYLVGTLDRFNNAKRAEVRDRTKHNV